MEVTGEVPCTMLVYVCALEQLQLVRVFEEYVTSWADLKGLFWFVPLCYKDSHVLSAV